jgi:ketosteroid isomerase-like protein
MSSLERNKTIARRWLELISDHDVDGICALTSERWTMIGGPPALPVGHAGVHALFRAIGPVYQEWQLDDIVAEGDRVVVRATNRCVQEAFFGLAGRGHEQVFTATFIHRIVDGLIVQTWRNADDLGRIFQLGGRIVQGPVFRRDVA